MTPFISSLIIGSICPLIVWVMTFSNSRRMSRGDYIIWTILLTIGGIIYNNMDQNNNIDGINEALYRYSFAHSFFIRAPFMLVTRFRCNDVGYNRYVSLIEIIPILNLILWLRLMFARSDEARKESTE
jgi:uncharacterized membrane protein YhaH (DUF805 family)